MIPDYVMAESKDGVLEPLTEVFAVVQATIASDVAQDIGRVIDEPLLHQVQSTPLSESAHCITGTARSYLLRQVVAPGQDAHA